MGIPFFFVRVQYTTKQIKMSYCVCEPRVINGVEYTEYSQFFGSALSECVFLWQDYVPSMLGLLSVLLWIFALMPQVWINYHNKASEALSLPFMLIWLFGDIFTLAGAAVLGMPTTAVALGVYFCLNDVVVLGQMYYYRKRATLCDIDMDGAGFGAGATATKSTAVRVCGLLFLGAGALSTLASATGSSEGASGQRVLLGMDNVAICDERAPRSDEVRLLGSVLSWIAGLLYFVSRIPQVIKNHKTKTCEGLSVSTFVIAALANTAFGLQFIAARVIASQRNVPMDWGEFVAEDLPFVIGSLGTLVYDITIVYQTYLYDGSRGSVGKATNWDGVAGSSSNTVQV